MYLQTFRSYSDWHHVANRRRFDAPPDPFEPIHVDPSSLEYCTHEVPLAWGLGRVEGGDWDREQNRQPLDESPIYRGLRQRFEEGRDWEETALYRNARDRFEDGQAVRGYESLAAFRDQRCAYVDHLFETIEREGYRPNREAGHENPAAEDNAFEDAYVHHVEPLVVVGRSGDVVLAEGYHRLTLAAILDVPEIPVQVLCRHEEWQRTRDAVATDSASDPAEGLDVGGDHPDLRDVVG